MKKAIIWGGCSVLGLLLGVAMFSHAQSSYTGSVSEHALADDWSNSAMFQASHDAGPQSTSAEVEAHMFTINNGVMVDGDSVAYDGNEFSGSYSGFPAGTQINWLVRFGRYVEGRVWADPYAFTEGTSYYLALSIGLDFKDHNNNLPNWPGGAEYKHLLIEGTGVAGGVEVTEDPFGAAGGSVVRIEKAYYEDDVDESSINFYYLSLLDQVGYTDRAECIFNGEGEDGALPWNIVQLTDETDPSNYQILGTWYLN